MGVIYLFIFSSLSGCPLNAQAIKKGKVSEELMTIKLKATGGKVAWKWPAHQGLGHSPHVSSR